MAAGSIVIDLLMKTGAFSTDVKRAEKELKELKEEAQAMGVVVGAAFTAAATAAAYMVKSAIDTMDEMSKLAQKTGSTTEELTALAYAANLSGVSHEELGASMVKLAKNMSDAANGTGEAAKAFEALHISVKNSDGSLKSGGQVISEVAGKFAGFSDSAEKTALAVAIFGKAGAQMIPLLNGGADGLKQMKEEAERLGLVIGGETGKAAEEFNDNLTRLHAATTGLANRAAAELLPALIDVSKMMLESSTNTDSLATKTSLMKIALEGLLVTFQTVAVVGSDLVFVLKQTGEAIGAVVAGYAALLRLDFSGFKAISDAVKADGERARAELDKFQAKIMSLGLASSNPMDEEARRRLGHGVPDVKASAPRLPGPPGPKGADPDADFNQYMKHLQEQIQKLDQLTASEKLLDDIRHGTLTVTPAQQKQLQLMAANVDAHKAWIVQMKDGRQRAIEEGDAIIKAAEEFQKWMLDVRMEFRQVSTDAGDKVIRDAEEFQRRLADLRDQSPTGQLVRQQNEVDFLSEAMRVGEITANEYYRQLDKITGKTDELTRVSDDLANIGGDALHGLVIEGASLNDVFKNVLKSLADMILKIGVIEPLAKQMRAAFTGGGGLGDFFAKLLGAGAGSGDTIGVPANPDFMGPIMARAGGGPVSADSPYLIGERGPEMFVPRTAGMIVPNQGKSNGAGGNITLVNQTKGRVDNVQEQRMPNGDRALLLQELAAEFSNGNSPLSRAMTGNFNVRRRR